MKGKFSLKTILLEVVKFALLAFIVANVVSYIRKPDLAQKSLPDLEVTLLDGSQKKLTDYKGKPLVLYFWGSWCPICKMSSPVISDLAKEYQVLTIVVNSGSSDEIKSFMQTHHLSFPVVNDGKGTLAQKFHVQTFPTTFIFSENGINTFTDVGYTSKWSLKLKLWLSRFMD